MRARLGPPSALSLHTASDLAACLPSLLSETVCVCVCVCERERAHLLPSEVTDLSAYILALFPSRM